MIPLLIAGVAAAQSGQHQSGQHQSGQHQSAAPDPRFDGTYRYDGSAEDAQQRVHEALQPLIAHLDPVMQPVAESRLSRGVPVARRIVIHVSDARIAVTYHTTEDRTFTSPPGEARNVELRNGEEARLVQRFRDGRLEQLLERDRGTVRNELRLDTSGRHLMMISTVNGGRLPAPIRVALPYVRAD